MVITLKIKFENISGVQPVDSPFGNVHDQCIPIESHTSGRGQKCILIETRI